MLNLVSPVNTLGYGLVGLNLLKAFARLGPVSLWPIGNVEADPANETVIRQAAANAVTYDPSAPSLRVWHAFEMSLSPSKTLRAGYTFFELDRVKPNEVHQLNALDLVFVPSRWAKGVLADSGVASERVRVAPCGVDREVFPVTPPPQGGPTTFFHAGKFEVRKGANFVRDAFVKAFTPKDDVRLVVCCHNPFLAPHQNAEWENYFTDHPLRDKVHLVRQRLPLQRDLADLMRGVDCGVFPARGEGWNCPLAECLAMGKAAIATNFSAHTEFVTPENCKLVGIDSLEDADDGLFFGRQPHQQQGKWAHLGPAQLDQIIEYMRAVHRQKQENGSLPLNQAGVTTFERLTWSACARTILADMGVTLGDSPAQAD
jgi:glycosyltransferase involved in cell wall biosynthesis